MQVTQFEVKTKNGLTVKGEYEGNIASKKVIIFSHGFGVTRDSHGMFTEIGDKLVSDYLVIRFDYTIVNKEENWTKVFSYSIQAEMLQAIHEYALSKFNPIEVDVIAHSMGCLITGLAGLKNIGTIILLAGPPVAPYMRMKEYFAKRPETTIDESSVSSIKRSDGSITYVESDFWDGMKTVTPPILYKELSTKSNVTFVRAISDQVITDVNYASIKGIQSIDYCELKGNHDFEGEDRFALIELIAKTFSEERIILVNSDDLVIGSIPRSRVTKQNIFRVSSLFLYDENGKILLGKRASSKRNNPDKWSPIVNGTNAVGESYESNILKEIREEINLAIDKVDLIKVVRVIENHDHFVAFFKAVIKSDLPVDFDKNEMSEIRWFTKDELYEDLQKSPKSFVPGFLENIYPLM